MIKFRLAILMVLYAGSCFAQREGQPPFIPPSHTDTLRLESLYDKGNSLLERNEHKSDLDSAWFYLTKAYGFGLSKHFEDQMNAVNYALGNVILLKKGSLEAEPYYNRVANYHRNRHDTLLQAATWRDLGSRILQTKNKAYEDRLMANYRQNKSDTLLRLTSRQNLSNRVFQIRDKAYKDKFDDATIYFTRAKALLGTIKKDTADVIRIRTNIGNNYHDAGYLEQARKEFLTTIEKYENSRFIDIDALYIALSADYRDEGNSNRSLFLMLKALKRVDRLRDTINADLAYGELALVYQELGQTENTIAWYKKTLELRDKIPGMPLISLYRTAGFLTLNLNKLGRSREALLYINRLEKRHPPITDDDRGMIAQVKAYCYEGLKQNQVAEKYYLQMIAYFKNTQLNFLIVIAKFDIGNFYVEQKAYDKAAYYLKDAAEQVANVMSIKSKVQLLLFKIDSAGGRPFQAIKHYQQFKQINDSLYNIAKSKQIEELQIQYATDQKEKDLVSLKKDSQLQHERVAQANYARNFTFIGIVALFFVVVLLYVSFRNNQRKSKVINTKNTTLNLLLTEKDSLLEEKEWLVKEVHHRVKNNLQIVMGLLERQCSFITNKQGLMALQNSQHRLYAIALIHQKLYQSESLTLVNMGDYIDEMIGYLRESFDLGSHIQFEKQIENLDLEIGLAVPLGLILNEAITNAIKYAFPTQQVCYIRISLTKADKSTYVLKIADNGKGLPADFDMKKANSMGFNLMRGLSKQVSGSFELVNDNGTTTIIRFDVTPDSKYD